jgi:DNA-binding NarL/FixJ family response regulator
MGGGVMPERHRPLLTPAQWLVLERLAAGEDNAAIGRALGIRPSTVTSHLKAIYQRLPYVSMGNKRAAAATWYLTVGRVQHDKEAS